MKLSDISVSCECEIISKNDQTQFYFDNVKYEVPFSFPIKSKDGLLFDKISTYFRSDSRENCNVVLTDVRFQLYYIELYENKFRKAMEDFKNIIFLACDDELKKDVLAKAFFNILAISTKSYEMADSFLTSDAYRRNGKTFRQYCGLDSSRSK